MRALLFVVSLIAALIALPAIAQQGPAGVPGAPGLAPPPPPPPPVPVASVPPPPSVAPAKQVQRRPANCHSSSEPARCERYRKARKQCAQLLGEEHRQCLRDTLTVKK